MRHCPLPEETFRLRIGVLGLAVAGVAASFAFFANKEGFLIELLGYSYFFVAVYGGAGAFACGALFGVVAEWRRKPEREQSQDSRAETPPLSKVPATMAGNLRPASLCSWLAAVLDLTRKPPCTPTLSK